jgi:putative transposase
VKNNRAAAIREALLRAREVRRVCRNVKRWPNAARALRGTAAGMMEAAKAFRRLKAYKHLPVLRAALAAHQSKYVIEHDADAA